MVVLFHILVLFLHLVGADYGSHGLFFRLQRFERSVPRVANANEEAAITRLHHLPHVSWAADSYMNEPIPSTVRKTAAANANSSTTRRSSLIPVVS